jgi:large subunit ribosomal protein L3
MSRVFLPTGEAIPVTYLSIEPNVIVRTKTKEKDGYNAVVLGIGAKKWKSRKGKENMRYLHQKEWQVESLDGMEPGKQITSEILPPESMVTISSTSKGKGFQGVVRRHHFAGGPATHGSHFKREPGSVGMRTSPGRILPGHRMAGHMGLETITLLHRPIVSSDTAKGIIAIKGPVPGPNGSVVFVTKESTPEAK